jgi:hypothetical protein
MMTSIKRVALTAAKWIGTGAGVSGAIMIALNLGLVIYGLSGWGLIYCAACFISL